MNDYKPPQIDSIVLLVLDGLRMYMRSVTHVCIGLADSHFLHYTRQINVSVHFHSFGRLQTLKTWNGASVFNIIIYHLGTGIAKVIMMQKFVCQSWVWGTESEPCGLVIFCYSQPYCHFTCMEPLLSREIRNQTRLKSKTHSPCQMCVRAVFTKILLLSYSH